MQCSSMEVQSASPTVLREDSGLSSHSRNNFTLVHYKKGNYFNIVEAVKGIMKDNGFIWQPSRTSEDMYEDDTGYFHKTLCFAIERSES